MSARKALIDLKAKRKEAIAVIAKDIRELQGERRKITDKLKGSDGLTILELEKATGMDSSKILRHIIALRKFGRLSEKNERDGYYVYRFKKSA